MLLIDVPSDIPLYAHIHVKKKIKQSDIYTENQSVGRTVHLNYMYVAPMQYVIFDTSIDLSASWYEMLKIPCLKWTTVITGDTPIIVTRRLR